MYLPRVTDSLPTLGRFTLGRSLRNSPSDKPSFRGREPTCSLTALQ